MAYIRSEKSCNVTFPITIIGYELKLLHNQHLQIDVILCSVFFSFFKYNKCNVWILRNLRHITFILINALYMIVYRKHVILFSNILHAF